MGNPSSSKSKISPVGTPIKKMSFASVLAAPSKTEVLARLQASIHSLEEENRDLKEHLATLELHVRNLTTAATNKAKDVDTKIEAHAQQVAIDITTKVGTCVSMELRERHFQEKNVLKVRIGGLPQAWDTHTGSFEDAITFLNECIKSIHIDPNSLEKVCNKADHKSGKRISSSHAILIFKDKESRLRLLQQSRLLKGTKLWIAEELTLFQLKHKEEQLKKVRAARAKGKWAVYRGGKAVIQEF